MKKLIGEILVDAGIISALTLERAIDRQKGSDRKLGVILEEMGVVTEEEVLDALSLQFSMQAVKQIRGHQFAPELFEIVPADIALKGSVFPLRLKDGVLSLAVSDPYAIEIVDNISHKTGLRVVMILSTETEIKAAIQEYYLKSVENTTSLTRILVVEDSPVVANVIKAGLEREGFEVLQASDGLEGLKMALSFKPSVILCDSVMPRMDGFGLKRALSARTETARIPVILLTSKASPEEEQKALTAGFFDFIAKPVNAVRIVSRIRRAIEMLSSPLR